MATRVEVLDASGRREEIARMLSGAKVTNEARAAADQLLSVTDEPAAVPAKPKKRRAT
jgi:DNA repair protein RecN (Recombination protein N)